MFNFPFDLDQYNDRYLAWFSRKIEEYNVSQQVRVAAIQKTKIETGRAFYAWTKRQAELVVDEMASGAPSRSGNLSQSIYAEAGAGRDWSIQVDESTAPYAKWVLQGRGPIAARGKYLVFRDTRYGWRPMGNLSRVSGAGAQRYPYTGNLRAKHTIPSVGGAPAIDFPGEGFNRWETRLLPGETQMLLKEIEAIVYENGGRVIRSQAL